MGTKIRKYYTVVRIGLLSNMTYKLNFAFESLFYVFIIVVFLGLWKTVYGQDTSLSGYTLHMLLWYLIITELITLSSSNVFENFSNDIRSGNIAYQLNKPYNLVLYHISYGFGQLLVKFFINVIVSLLIGLLFIGTFDGLSLNSLIVCILPFFLGVILNTLVFTAASLLSFWTEDSTIFYFVTQKLVFIFGMFMPLEFYPAWLQKIMLLTPFPYITYGPAKLCVNFSVDNYFNVLQSQFLFIGIVILIISILFKKGVRMLNVSGG